MKSYYIYILASQKNGTLYIGVTNDLHRRIYEHKNNLIKGFTKKYQVNKLVYFEETTDIYEAIKREKQLKKWNREWKLNLINEYNKDWVALYEELFENDQRFRCSDPRFIGTGKSEHDKVIMI